MPCTYFYNTNNNANYEYILDGKPGHIAASYWNSAGQTNRGYLKAGLNGGILLAQTNAFDLVTAPSFSAADYAGKPDTNLWTVTTNASFADPARAGVRITLTNACKQADLNMNGARSAGFNARAKGYVTIANLNSNAMDNGLAVYLDVDTTNYNNTVTNLVAGLVAAGYTNSAADASGVYDLRVVIPKSYLTANNPNYFVWDFTDTSGSTNGAGATNATVSGLRFVNWPVRAGMIFMVR